MKIYKRYNKTQHLIGIIPKGWTLMTKEEILIKNKKEEIFKKNNEILKEAKKNYIEKLLLNDLDISQDIKNIINNI